MLIEGKKNPGIRGGPLTRGRKGPVIVQDPSNYSRRGSNYDETERIRMFTSEGAPLSFAWASLLGPIKGIADTIADTVRGKSGGIEGAIGEGIGNLVNRFRQPLEPKRRGKE